MDEEPQRIKEHNIAEQGHWEAVPTTSGHSLPDITIEEGVLRVVNPGYLRGFKHRGQGDVQGPGAWAGLTLRHTAQPHDHQDSEQQDIEDEEWFTPWIVSSKGF